MEGGMRESGREGGREGGREEGREGGKERKGGRAVRWERGRVLCACVRASIIYIHTCIDEYVLFHQSTTAHHN